MKNTLLLVGGLVLAVITFLVVRSPHWKAFMAFRAPITFYGKVIDQHGDPVANADIKMSANDGTREGKPYSLSTDANGEFSIKRIRGLSLFVKASKDGYHRVLSRDGRPGSENSFGYGIDLGSGAHVPDKSRPVLFLLHKAGPLETLEKRERDIRLMRNGKPYRSTLHRDKTSRAHVVEVSCETRNKGSASHHKYDWHFKINVPDGGLTPRHDEFHFEAPVDGYQPGDACQMLASDPDGVWKDSVERSYFVRFNDGVHARLDVRMITGGDHFVVLKSFLNPKPGSRNLETPPKN